MVGRADAARGPTWWPAADPALGDVSSVDLDRLDGASPPGEGGARLLGRPRDGQDGRGAAPAEPHDGAVAERERVVAEIEDRVLTDEPSACPACGNRTLVARPNDPPAYFA